MGKAKRSAEKESRHVRKLQLLEANKEEDKVIRRLEKALKLKKRKKLKNKNSIDSSSSERIPNIFKDDGLDYILSVVDVKEKNIRSGESNDREPNENLSLQKRKNSTLHGNHKRSPVVEGDKKPCSKSCKCADSQKNKGICINCGGGLNSDIDEEDIRDGDSSQETAQEESEPVVKPKVWEDIYGRLRDEHGNVIQNSNVKNESYIPPAKRLKSETNNEEKSAILLRIQKQLKGLLNRLSESNMQQVFSQIEQIYMQNSRNDVNETLLFLVSEHVISSVLTPPRLIMEQAMLITLLHGAIGSEVGAYFLQSFCTRFHKLMTDGSYGQGKECNNMLIFLSHLYNFKVTQCTLLFDILKCLVDSFTDKAIELIQLVLKTCGFGLRKDSPLKLKEIIHLIQTKAVTFQSEESSSRIQFMLDTMTAIRNNNMHKLAEYDPSVLEHAKKVLRSLMRQGTYIEEMPLSLEDLLKAEENGRWWIVGSAFSGKCSSENNDQNLPTKSASMQQLNVSDKILELARKQRMNTDIRRTIFCIIMTAEDYMDAFEKLLHMNLKHQQQREIFSVILHCTLNEKKFNPYYAFLAGRFCGFSRKYFINLQFALWDKFKDLHKLKSHQVNNLACFLKHLFIKGEMPISVLKVIHFAELDKLMIKFLRQILLGILLHDSEEECSAVFKRIAAAKNLNVLREGLRLFMFHFLLQSISSFEPDKVEKLKQRVKVAESALFSAKHAFKL